MKEIKKNWKIGVLSVADIHTHPDKRYLDPYRTAFDKIIEYATEYKVDLISNEGDNSRDAVSSREADDCIMSHLYKPAAKAGILQLIIDGNHCKPGAKMKEVTVNSHLGHMKDKDLWAKLDYISDYKLRKYNINGATLQVLPLPYPARASFSVGKSFSTKAELEQAASAFLMERLAEGVKAADEDLPLLIKFHGTISGTKLKLGGEVRMPCGVDVSLPLDAFPKWKNCVVSCGHIHKRQTLSEISPMLFYCANLVPMEFDSEDDEKGVTHIEWTENGPTYKFLPIITIGYKTVTVDLGMYDSSKPIEEYIKDAVKSEVPNPDQTVVKVIIKAKEGNDEPNKGAIRDTLEKAGIVDARIMVEEPQSKSLQETDRIVDTEIGQNYVASVISYLSENTEQQTALEAVNASQQDVVDVATEVELEAATL